MPVFLVVWPGLLKNSVIIKRYFLREIGLTFLGVTLLLLLILISGTLVRILAEAVEGDYPVSIIFSLLGLKAIANLMLLIPLAFFLAIMLALGRLYRDSEMIAMTACGVRPRQVFFSVGRLSLLVAGGVAGLSLYLAPYAEEMGHRLLDEAQATTEIGGIVPGRFTLLGDGAVLLYVEEMDKESNILKKVFVQTQEEGREYLLTAARAFQQTSPATGDRYLVLEEGYRYERTADKADFRILRFKQHGLRLQERKIIVSKRRRNAVLTSTLLKSDSPADIAELQWRIAAPISTVLLGFLGVLLSKSSPRQGRYGKLFIGIVIYVVYNNLLSVARSSLSDGETNPLIGMWWVHLLFIVIMGMLMWGQRKLPGPKPGNKAAPA